VVCWPADPKDYVAVFFSVVKESEVATEILQGFIETRRRRRFCL